jgi:hypothetical protein
MCVWFSACVDLMCFIMVEDPSSITLAVSNANHVWANFHFLSFIIIIFFLQRHVFQFNVIGNCIAPTCFVVFLIKKKKEKEQNV